MPFLTDLDERAQVKGSVDPLGLVPIWSRLGREVVGNLTTVTTSVRGFTTLLLGLYFAERVQDADRSTDHSRLDLFLKFEQMSGYARVKINGENEAVRGVRRIKQNLNERRRVSISAAPADQILSNQKVYGLWGLFSVAARSSELLEPGEQRLNSRSRQFIEDHYLPMLSTASNDGREIIHLLRKESFIFDCESDLAQRLAKVHARRLTAAEKTFYRDHLAWGGEEDSTGGRQRALAEMLTTTVDDEVGFDEVEKVKRKAEREKGDVLAMSLDRILAAERLFSPARVIFGYLQTQDSQPLDDVALRIGKEWKRSPRLNTALLVQMRPDIARMAGSEKAATQWLDLVSLFENGDYRGVVARLIDINTEVMQSRNGSSPWVAVENGRLRVRMTDESEDRGLRSVSEAEKLWRSTYFINALALIAREVA